MESLRSIIQKDLLKLLKFKFGILPVSRKLVFSHIKLTEFLNFRHFSHFLNLVI